MAVSKKDGRIAFRKTAFRTHCQICPKIPLRPGIKIAITFSPMLETGGSYAPLPYFGVRGAKGREKVLQHLEEFPPEPSKQYEIYLEASQTGVTCLYACPDRNKTVLKSFSPRDFGSKGLPNPVLVYFHMNDVSGLIIHDIRSNQVQATDSSNRE